MQHQSDINTSLLASDSNTSYQSIMNENNTGRNETDVETYTADFLHFDPVDVQRVQRAIEEAGSNACGIMGIDVWMLNDSDGKLYHFDKGMNWINPIYRAQLAGGTDEENEEKIQILHRLVDTDNPEYYHPIPQPSGVGLAGNYWQHFGDVAGSASYFQESLVWREVRAFTSDPDQMPYERMFAVERLFGKCTGVPFNIFGAFKGVVVFYARGSAEERIINTASNSNFMRMASYNIGSALAMSRARLHSMQSRSNLARSLFAKVRIAFATVKILKSVASKSNLMQESFTSSSDMPDPFDNDASFEALIKAGIRNIKHKVKACVSYTRAKANSVKNKTLRPPAIKPPPPANVFVSGWSFIGCLSILLVLFGFQKLLIQISDGSLGLILPPFGALMALQFSLTAAPASQPRNSLFGFILSISVVMVNKILLHHVADLPQWFHASLGTSLAIFSMQKFGLVHPPAGAAAFVFALSRKDIASDFFHAGALLLADVIAIGLAVFFNNLSDTRQYPMYWKLNPFS